MSADLRNVEAGNIHVNDEVLLPGDLIHRVLSVDVEGLSEILIRTDFRPNGLVFASTEMLRVIV